MNDGLKEKYNISETFYNRYIKENAQNRFGIELAKFMWFKEGKFLVPTKKDYYLEQFEEEEIENFYEKHELNIPFLEFNVTTRCTLKCRDCCAFIPQFNHTNHFDLKFSDFKEQLNKITEIANIRNLVLLGGEPLINSELPQMVEYAAQKENISIIRITTNGTMIPSEKLLNVIKKYPNRVYFYLSNYGGNPSLNPILKYDELKKLLYNNNIRFQMVDSWAWMSELGMAHKKYDEKITIKKVQDCFRTKCTHILNGKIDVCSKAHGATALGLIKTTDAIDIIKSKNLKKDLINFYQKPYPEACEYCILSDTEVSPAIQN